MQSLTNGDLSRNWKAILFRVDYIVASTLYKGAIIQENEYNPILFICFWKFFDKILQLIQYEMDCDYLMDLPFKEGYKLNAYD